MSLTIAILIIVFGFVTVMVVISNYFSYKEKELLFKEGASPEVAKKVLLKSDSDQPVTKLGNLRSGVTLVAVGGALTIGLSFMGFTPALLGGLIPLFLGIARIILYYILPDDDDLNL